MFPRRVFVTPSEVKTALSSLRIIDVRYSLEDPQNYGITEFKKLRAADASFVDLDEEITAHLPHSTARHPLPPCADFVDFCKRRGIGGKPVLCYDDQSGGMAACRMWWMLDAVGVEAYVLDGGIQGYVAAGLPTASGDAQDAYPPSTTWPYATEFSKSLLLNEIPLEAKIVDARLALRFDSTVRPYGLDTIPGHFPGSVNHPWNANINDKEVGQKQLCSEEVLREKWDKTLDGEKHTAGMVFTCASGVTACMNIALMKHLGYGTPFLYAGAWSEYCGLCRFQLQRQTIQEHGLCFTMKSRNLPANAKAAADNCTLVVDDKEMPFADAPSDVQRAAAHLHIGERGVATFASGAKYDIQVRMK